MYVNAFEGLIWLAIPALTYCSWYLSTMLEETLGNTTPNALCTINLINCRISKLHRRRLKPKGDGDLVIGNWQCVQSIDRSKTDERVENEEDVAYYVLWVLCVGLLRLIPYIMLILQSNKFKKIIIIGSIKKMGQTRTSVHQDHRSNAPWVIFALWCGFFYAVLISQDSVYDRPNIVRAGDRYLSVFLFPASDAVLDEFVVIVDAMCFHRDRQRDVTLARVAVRHPVSPTPSTSTVDCCNALFFYGY